MTEQERIKVIDYVRGELPIDYLTETTIIPVEFEERSSRIPIIIRDTEDIEATVIDFYAQKGQCVIRYGTTEEWNAQPSLITDKGTIYVYLDKEIITDTEGNITYIPGIKVGLNNNYLINTPFIGDDIWQHLLKHIQNAMIHIQPGERERWNNKLNYIPPSDELLEFTRD